MVFRVIVKFAYIQHKNKQIYGIAGMSACPKWKGTWGPPAMGSGISPLIKAGSHKIDVRGWE